MKSLGVFAISIVAILLILLIYIIIKKCGGFCNKIKTKIQDKLFYSGPIRYIIVGYIKLLNQFLTLFLIGTTKEEFIPMLIGYFIAILFLNLWPIWSAFYLMKNKDRLEESTFKTKFSSLY